MKNRFKKYFLSTLAVLLILSNFSFATTYAICSMKDADSPCSCEHKSHTPVKFLSISQDKSECCSEGTTELANSNLLSTVKVELPFDISSFAPAVINTDFDIYLSSNNNSRHINLAEHVPKDDIPILYSTLLI